MSLKDLSGKNIHTLLFRDIKVEKILRSKISQDGIPYFEVKWINSWVSKHNLEKLFGRNADILIENFYKRDQVDTTSNKDEVVNTNAQPNGNNIEYPAVNIKNEIMDDELYDELEETIFMCDICNTAFQTHRLLSCHKHSCSSKSPSKSAIPDTQSYLKGRTCLTSDDNPESEYGNLQNETNYNKVAEASSCALSTDSTENTIECTLIDESENNARQNSEDSISDGKRCRQCTCVFKSQEEFDKHTENHLLTTDTVYECENCGMTFADVEYLTRHQVRCKDQALASYRCDICQRGFTAKGSLDLHVDTVHLKKKEFGCSICGRLFSRKHILKIHLATHYGKREFQCETCGKTFLQKGNLNRHERIHQAKNFGYKCRYCGQAFTQNKHLQKHLVSHHGLNTNQEKASN